MTSYLWAALGGALGSVTRFWLSGRVDERWETFPWGTMVVNLTGSVLIGVLAALSEPEGRWLIPTELRQFLMILDPMIKSGLVTTEKVRVIEYRANPEGDAPAPLG